MSPATEQLTRQEWLTRRSQIITATDVAKIVGVSPWGGPLDVYAVKRGIVQVEDNPAMALGRRLQPVVLDLYEQDTGESLCRFGDTELVVSPELPWAGATPDAVRLRDHNPVEAKTAGHRQASRWGESGTDDVPDEYLIQVQWQMLVTGAKAAELAVLLAGQDFRIYPISRHDALIGRLVESCERFLHDHLEAGVPPEITEPAGAARWLRAVYPRDTRPDLLTARESEESLATRLHESRCARDEMQNTVDLLEAQIKSAIGEAAGIEGRLWRATWKATKDTSVIDWPALALHLAKDIDTLQAAKTRFTTIKPGARRFFFKFNGEE